MRPLVLLVSLIIAPAALAQTSAFERQRALDELQAAIGLWMTELRAFNREVAALERDRVRRSEEARLDDAGTEISIERPTSPRQPSRYGKVIEVAPPEEDAAAVPEDGVEAEVLRMEQALEEQRRACEENPAKCQKERETRQVIREGNRAWDDALEKKRKQREAEIEERARQIQAELDAVRRREAEERARRMGGKVDAEGNFVDTDLDRELEADADAERR